MRKILYALGLLAGIMPAVAAAQVAPPVLTTMDDGTRRGSVPSANYCINSTNTAWVPCPVSTGGGGGGSSPSSVAQGSTTAGQQGDLTQGTVRSTDSAFTEGTTQALQITPAGRLRVATTYATNITPAAFDGTTTTRSALVGCRYYATPPTWTDTWSGSITCDSTGAQRTSVTSSTLPTGAATETTLSTRALESTQSAMSAKLPSSVGSKTGALSLSVVPASDGFSVVGRGGGTLNTNQVSIGTTSTLLVAARTGRQKVIVTVNAAVACAFGNTGVTTATGFPLQPTAGATITLDTSAAIYGACGTAATTVGFVELY